jgi:23S rRNA (adenine2503-C2)-methyltransferase
MAVSPLSSTDSPLADAVTQATPLAEEILPAPLLGKSLEELTEWVQAQGQPSYRGKQLYQWIYQQGARSLQDITVFSKAWRQTVVPRRPGTIHPAPPGGSQ